MKVILTPTFERSVKKLHQKDKEIIYDAIDAITNNPQIGEAKVGDLRGIRVHKFILNKQKVLLAYRHINDIKHIVLIYFDSHENFYRDLKKIV